ncbi:TRAP transporter large permease [Desulfofustis glycolicus]|uniref:TRAP transporter, DctM subunit n=1 Tax=Desulfofustis glycolicus DSM 9705 TaxID=1121409 RepID=A0A1M5T8U6_9BACT|nr:TRAP transporter large permease [Desulfofustis glycolicus]MCB2215422.1 TRAP transporter large permease [Desulfobulbaceae bacterium]SHH47134.1 TRAP transporter, DctM subunit [Desulfofustis glycolicus DSM 9705]
MLAEILIFFVAGLALLFLGVPISPVMAIIGLIGGLLAFGYPFMNSIGSVVWGVHNSFILTAVPLFILMGEILLRSGVADKMYNALAKWMNWLPGNLLHTNIGCCALFAATTGSSVACAATVGTVALPTLNERGFSKKLSLGSLAAGGTMGILIPPSIALIIYGSLTNNSISQLFVAGVIPGIVLTLAFFVYLMIASISIKNTGIIKVSWPERIRALPEMLPPLFIFFIVMGSIYFGLATPTESAALGIIASLFFAWRGGKLTFAMLHKCFVNTAQLTGMIILIITAAFILNLTLSLLGIAEMLTQQVLTLDLTLTQLTLVMILFYIVLGMFLDVLSIQVATIPIAYPIMTAAGADPIWFGIFIVLMSEVAMITPPMGMNLFVIQGVRQDKGPLSDVIWGALPFALIMLAFTVFLIFYPEVVTWLPAKMRG